ncbi:nuclear transport factor 2 family protein [Polaromonas sp.]|uniref:nuclear transport factor 2 family protein n=1 Tax=Polaromonas sp. TaxID=1869339 RepID=UPI003BAB6464
MASPNEQGLLAAEEARRQAMLANDTAKLDALLSDGLVYVHSSGGKDSKQSYLQKISTGVLLYESLEFITPVARVIGMAGLVTAGMRATVSGSNSQRRNIASTYLAVWEHGASGWVLQLVQATPLPAAS